jgi:hypothetical protein
MIDMITVTTTLAARRPLVREEYAGNAQVVQAEALGYIDLARRGVCYGWEAANMLRRLQSQGGLPMSLDLGLLRAADVLASA